MGHLSPALSCQSPPTGLLQIFAITSATFWTGRVDGALRFGLKVEIMNKLPRRAFSLH
jgi:hypothetical protein